MRCFAVVVRLFRDENEAGTAKSFQGADERKKNFFIMRRKRRSRENILLVIKSPICHTRYMLVMENSLHDVYDIEKHFIAACDFAIWLAKLKME